MIVSTPLDLPKIQPDSWDKFWDIWNKYAEPLVKVGMNTATSPAPVGSVSVWHGLDIFKQPYGYTYWSAPYYDTSSILPNFHEAILGAGFGRLFRVRVLMSHLNVTSHTDDNADKWQARAFLHYTSDKQQWYFTRPGDAKGERTYLSMPEDTNWFTYNDKFCWHGTDFDPNHKKVLLQIYSGDGVSPDLLERSLEKYKDYTISYD